MTIFDKVAEPGWTWFEEGLTYDNAKLAHALIVSGRATGQTGVYERGIQALRWLVGVQTSERGQLRPIGSNGFYQRNGARADFDQQPIEAQSTVSACLEAYRATADLWWYEQAQRAFDWFLGWNDLGLELYARETGGCRDGLHADRSNENQGAESMLAFLLSLAEMRLIQNTAIGIQTSRHGSPDHSMKQIDVKRSTVTLDPDRTHVLARPFRLMSDQRSIKIAARVMALPEDEVHTLLDGVRAEFGDRQLQIDEFLRRRFDEVSPYLLNGQRLSEERKLLLGGYFTHEYSLEAAALFNPSMVPHPDQSDVPPGSLRFILSLRATAEGHVSSIAFRSGMLDANSNITMDVPSRYSLEPMQVPNSTFEKPLFERKLQELRLMGDFNREVLNGLPDAFTMEELRASINRAAEQLPDARAGNHQEHSQTNPDARQFQLRSAVRAGVGFVRTGFVPRHPFAEQRDRGCSLCPLPQRRRHATRIMRLTPRTTAK